MLFLLLEKLLLFFRNNIKVLRYVILYGAFFYTCTEIITEFLFFVCSIDEIVNRKKLMKWLEFEVQHV